MAITVGDMRMVSVVESQRLTLGQYMLLTVVAHQRLVDDSFARLATAITVAGQHDRVTFAGQDASQDTHANLAGDIVDCVIELKIHLHQRFLLVRGSIGQQTLKVPDQRTPIGQLLRWSETASQ